MKQKYQQFATVWEVIFLMDYFHESHNYFIKIKYIFIQVFDYFAPFVIFTFK